MTSKRGPSTALRARENRGKDKGARNFAQDDVENGKATAGKLRRVDAVRGYEENLYTRVRAGASGCWCKEKSSTVRVKKMAG